MAQVIGNQYYDPSARAAEVSQGVGGLAEALFGNPTKATANDFQLSEAALNKAKTQRQLMANTAVGQGLADALNSGDLNKIIAQSAAGEITPEFAKMSNPIAIRDEGLKPQTTDEAMARVFQSLSPQEQRKVTLQHIAPDRSGMPTLDPETGEITPGIAAPDMLENQGAPQFTPDNSTMGSMINSLNQPAPKAAADPPQLPPSGVQNGSAQDPVTASRDAIAAQQQVTGVSPAQRPDLQSPTPEQVLQRGAPAQPAAPPHQRTFGFNLSGTTGPVYKGMVENDKKQIMAAQNNVPIASNVMRILDMIEPNLKNFNTGFMGDTRLTGDKALALFDMNKPEATAGGNIDKATSDLVTELQKFQYMPGMRGSVLGLQTMLASKPGIGQQPETNANIVAGIRAKVMDYQLSTELAQKYREASPLKVTDSNTTTLDNALKTIFPIEIIDQKTGAVTFNKQNALKIRQSIPQAIASPKQFIDHANEIMAGQAQPEGGAPIQPTATAESPEAKALKAGFTPEQIQEYKTQRGIK